MATEAFHQKMARFKRRNGEEAERIDKRILDLRIDPYHNTIVLHDPAKPFRRVRVGDRRLFYQYCKDCRLRGVEEKTGCDDCEDTDDETIKLFDFDDRDNVYDKKRRKS